MKTNTVQTLLAAVLFTAAGSSHAALVTALNGQVVNDTDLNVTWLANANLAATNTFGVNGINAVGQMTWSTAQSWISAMNTADYLGYSDWRLPTSGTCSGYNCTGSEMGHLFYNELGGVAVHSITTTHNTNYSLFQNFQPDYYWSGTEYAPSTDVAWDFDFSSGYQYDDYKSYEMSALAVHPGQVDAIPVPGAGWLLGSGVLGLIGVARRKAA